MKEMEVEINRDSKDTHFLKYLFLLIYLPACGIFEVPCGMGTLGCSLWDPSRQCMDSQVVIRRLSGCSKWAL